VIDVVRVIITASNWKKTVIDTVRVIITANNWKRL
jgi:hypothetical protein